jgi:hypothetical protein
MRACLWEQEREVSYSLFFLDLIDGVPFVRAYICAFYACAFNQSIDNERFANVCLRALTPMN